MSKINLNTLTPKTELGRVLRDARTRLGLSQEAAAKLIGANQWSLSDWEIGWKSPRKGRWAAIEKALMLGAGTIAQVKERA